MFIGLRRRLRRAPHGEMVGTIRVFRWADAEHPAPSRLPLGPLMDYGYEGTAVFPFDLSNSPQTPLGRVHLKAHVQWLVCRDVRSSWKSVPRPQAQRSFEGIFRYLQAHRRRYSRGNRSDPPASVKIGVTATRGTLTLNVVTGKKEISAEYYPLDDDSIRNAAEQKIEPTADGVRLVTERADISDTLPKELKGVLKLSDGRSYTFNVPVETGIAHSSGGNEPAFSSRGCACLRGGNHPESDAVCFPGAFPQSTGSRRKCRREQDGAASAWDGIYSRDSLLILDHRRRFAKCSELSANRLDGVFNFNPLASLSLWPACFSLWRSLWQACLISV